MTRTLSLKRGLIAGLAVSFAMCFSPIAVFADSSSTCTPPAEGSGVHRPVGADASTYSYDCATGMWVNQYYTFNPANDQVTPNYQVTYTYDSSTGLYNYPDYIFDAPTGQYNLVTQSTQTPPAGADVVGAPAPAVTSTSSNGGSGGSSANPDSSISDTGTGSNNTINGDGGSGGDISDTGTGSNNSVNGNNSNDLSDNNNTNANITNTLTSTAGSGDAAVLDNTNGGSATSGDASDVVNSVNLLQSAASALGSNADTFVANINGDVNGDLLIDPANLGSVQGTADPTSGNNNLTIDNSTNASIDNNINETATSGAATVADNNNGGDATSGSASTVADVVNLIDSDISSGQSFVGVININGNLNGNILIPQDLFNQLLASNVPTVTISDTGTGSQNTDNTGTSNTTTVNNTNNEGINNNVNSTATSGTADVADNTNGGSATTGSATTTITAFNLTVSNVIGANDLLVFVNVSGSWVGMIINAPAGATAAEFGGGITGDTTTGNNSTTVNNNTNQTINNNIDQKATSGDATVADNTNGGSATSGNASNAVNLFNVDDSNLSLSGWFGILFINVFGNWNGNFGTYPPDTASIGGGSSDSTSSTVASNARVPAQLKVFRFIPSSTTTSGGNGGSSISDTGTGSTNTISGSGSTDNGVLASSVKLGNNKAPAPQLSSGHKDLALPIIAGVICVGYLVGDTVISHRKRVAAAAKQA